MKTTEATTAIDTALEQLRADLAAGRSEALTEYLTAMSRFTNYSFGNVMLIMSQRPSATLVAGYRAWNRLGRHVNRGEKGIAIIAPVTRRKSEDESEKDSARNRVAGFRAVYVFDIAQTEGDPLPEPDSVQGDPGLGIERLYAFAAQRNITIEQVENLGNALGRSHGGRIELAAHLEPAEAFATLAHELAHELLHQGDNKNRPADKSVRETEAEAVAYAVCIAAGLEPASACRDYIHMHGADAETLMASLERIRSAAAPIIDALTSDNAVPAA